MALGSLWVFENLGCGGKLQTKKIGLRAQALLPRLLILDARGIFHSLHHSKLWINSRDDTSQSANVIKIETDHISQNLRIRNRGLDNIKLTEFRWNYHLNMASSSVVHSLG